MREQPFLKLNRGDFTFWLMSNHPRAYLLLNLIALRACRNHNDPNGLKIGEAFVGDYEAIGATRGEYRHALGILKNLTTIKIVETCRNRKKATTGTTTVGTKVLLLNSRVWDINPEINNHRNDHPTTTEQPFLKLNRGDFTFWLMSNHPRAYLLLNLIALRACRNHNDPNGLKIGEAFVGDHEAIGATRGEYRHALSVLKNLTTIKIVETCRNRKKATTEQPPEQPPKQPPIAKKATTGTTTVGTKVMLLNSMVWDINPETNNHQNNHRLQKKQPPEQPSNNHEEEFKKFKKYKNNPTSPFSPSKDEKIPETSKKEKEGRGISFKEKIKNKLLKDEEWSLEQFDIVWGKYLESPKNGSKNAYNWFLKVGGTVGMELEKQREKRALEAELEASLYEKQKKETERIEREKEEKKKKILEEQKKAEKENKLFIDRVLQQFPGTVEFKKNRFRFLVSEPGYDAWFEIGEMLHEDFKESLKFYLKEQRSNINP